jgi:DNA-binding response OmpR family regulator
MSDKKQILYVEDDETLGYITRDSLELQGFQVIHCSNGADAIARFNPEDISICLLDVMLPKIDGFSVAREIRRIDQHVPIIFITARSLKDDRIEGLRIGADDYIVKPFSIEELILKIKVFLKRSRVNQADDHAQIVKLGLFSFDRNNQTLSRGTEEIRLTQREAELLLLLIGNKNHVVKKEDILKTIWFDTNSVYSRSVDVFISRLRKMLIADPDLKIENIHGVGYRLRML